jgi:hypothetical protein
MVSQLASKVQTVTVVKDDSNPKSRYQVLDYSSGETSPQLVHSCQTQGGVTAWLVCHGYNWVKDSIPQKWTKVL